MIALMLVATVAVIAQKEYPATNKNASNLSALDFMIGDWEGEGWIQMGRDRKTFKIKESFTRKLSGSLVVVDGLGTNINKETGLKEIIHTAYGVFYYDAKVDKIGFRYYKEDGTNGQTYPEFSENKMVWGFIAEPSKSEIRFTEMVDVNGFWVANGEVKPPGRDQWFPFFYMKLNRIK